jgi:hypothetical protein
MKRLIAHGSGPQRHSGPAKEKEESKRKLGFMHASPSNSSKAFLEAYKDCGFGSRFSSSPLRELCYPGHFSHECPFLQAYLLVLSTKGLTSATTNSLLADEAPGSIFILSS